MGQSSLLSYRDKLEYIIAWSKIRYYTFQAANNKGTDQTMQMYRQVYVFVVHKTTRSDLFFDKAHTGFTDV